MLHSMINQRLGRYTVNELLGRGGMAAVYRARDAALQRDVALKILYPQYSDDESLVERFKREAIMAASLDHPNIAPVYDVGEQDGITFMAMKLLHGRPFVDLLNERGSLPINELLPILEQVASALDYAHSKGVIHRDIKPGNIMLELPRHNRVAPPPASSATATGVGAPPALGHAAAGPLPPDTVAILTDFGIAKSLDAPGLTTTGAMLGTPDYMAPEQIIGGPVDRRADVYALGVLVYRVLAGQRPFGGSTQDVLMGHLKVMPEDPSFLNQRVLPALDPVIMRALAKKPEDRFGTAGEFVRALRAAAEGKRVLLPPPPVSPPEQPTRINTPQPGSYTQPTTQRTPARQPAGPAQVMARTALPVRPITQPPLRRANRNGWLLGLLALALLAALGMIGYGATTLLGSEPPLPTLARATATLEGVAVVATEASTATASSTIEATTETVAPPSPTIEQPIESPALPSQTPANTTATAAPPTRTPVPPTSTVAPPTNTPVPPTSTVAPPTNTSVPPTNTPVPPPPPTEIACNTNFLRQGSGFRVLYENDIGVRGTIGCPTGDEQGLTIADQVFERGTMYWWTTRDTVYAMPETEGRGGRYQAFTKNEAAALPEPPQEIDPLINRQGGFARVYYGVEAIRTAIGGPVTTERGTNGAFQQFENGFMIWSPAHTLRGRMIYVLYNDGSFRRYDDVNPN